ncbi:hypothetical protein G3480_09095 [Thiorhodococcus mannitoliphagus]|uniref:Uncharacterized protein n=1 Tax=Thiorhodococcus mannitoliphagus TaxID=329406 RepID=A0A6P1DWG3_9GAMM|nr:hypothetical protein [Thiorhodococcus mannitoliphagus]NEX20462.1 hypothetical protein [Thiorhodococcus mannitoliphagus]
MAVLFRVGQWGAISLASATYPRPATDRIIHPSFMTMTRGFRAWMRVLTERLNFPESSTMSGTEHVFYDAT